MLALMPPPTSPTPNNQTSNKTYKMRQNFKISVCTHKYKSHDGKEGMIIAETLILFRTITIFDSSPLMPRFSL